MSDTGSQLGTLRPSRRYFERLMTVLVASLLLHLLIWGGYTLGQKYGWWDPLHWPAWMHRQPKLVALVQPQVQQEEPIEFVSVDNPSKEAPKKAKFYSSQNSRAADQTNQRDTDRPKEDGRKTEAMTMRDQLRPDFNKPKPPEPKQTEQEQKPVQKEQKAGDITMGKPQPEQPPARPRTLAQARAMEHLTPGVKAQMDGGALRRQVQSSLDAIGTPFGQYDAAIVDAVTQYWYNELDSQKFALDRSGKVVVQFRLNDDGSVTEVQEMQNTVGFELGLVCQDAITGPAPFGKWPEAMRQYFGRNYRIITFTFDYYY